MPTFVLTEGSDNFIPSGLLENQELTVLGLGGDDVIFGGLLNDSLFGGNGRDWLVGDVASPVIGAGGDDSLHGGADDDLLEGSFGDDALHGDDGNDELRGGSDNDWLFGGIGGDRTFGGSGNDQIFSGAGADLLDGGSGNDRLLAEGSFIDGPDVLLGGADNDVYILSGAGVFDIRSQTEAADPGIDRVEAAFDLNLTSLAGIENATLLGGGSFAIAGNGRDNTLVGNAAGNALSGAAGADRLLGQDGNDTLDGGTGADTMLGGAGDDSYVVDHSFDRTIENANAGHDAVFSSISWSLVRSPNVEDLFLRDGALNGTGNALDNRVNGSSDANTLDGGLGFDAMAGGLGNDIYVLRDTSRISVLGVGRYVYDTVFEGANSGIDTVYVYQAPDPLAVGGLTTVYTLGANIENGRVLGAGAFSLLGNELGNALTGNNDANRLAGFGGADLLDGGGGNDTLEGGLGDDVYFLRDTNRINVLGVNIYVYDSVVEAANGGIDTVVVFQAADPFAAGGVTTSFTLGATIENGTIGGAEVFNLGGNALGNKLIGNSAANRIGGGAAGNDQLYGQGGDDYLDGGNGVDFMAGGTGNDIYNVDATGDRCVELAGQGIDSVISRISYTLEANVEVLSLFGSSNLAGNGNALDNVIQGQFGANVLRGFAGRDKLEGFGGNDTLYGGLDFDTLFGNEGADRFMFDTALDGLTNIDTIADFAVADDTILLDNAIFTALVGTGVLSASAFRIGAAAADADDRIVYDGVSGQLFYDADGNAAAAAIRFAEVGPGLALTAADFIVT